MVAKVFNIVGASCKRRDILREKRNAEVIEALKNNEISTGHGLNQEMSLKRPGDTVLIMVHLLILFTCFLL